MAQGAKEAGALGLAAPWDPCVPSYPLNQPPPQPVPAKDQQRFPSSSGRKGGRRQLGVAGGDLREMSNTILGGQAEARAEVMLATILAPSQQTWRCWGNGTQGRGESKDARERSSSGPMLPTPTRRKLCQSHAGRLLLFWWGAGGSGLMHSSLPSSLAAVPTSASGPRPCSCCAGLPTLHPGWVHPTSGPLHML